MCGDINDKISLYIDNQLIGEEAEEFKKHINECEACRKEYFEFADMINEIKTITQAELPEKFHAELITKLNNTVQDNQKENLIETDSKNKLKPSGFAKKYKWRKYTTVAASVLALVIIVTAIAFVRNGIGMRYSSGNTNKNSASIAAQSSDTASTSLFNESKSSFEGIAEDSVMMEMEEAGFSNDLGSTYTTTENQATPAGSPVQSNASSGETSGINRKIIKNSYISLEVDSFDKAAQVLKSATEQSGGYVESFQSYSNGTYFYNDQTVELKGGSIVLRIPSAKYDSINYMVSQLGKIISQNESSENVTAQYIDTEARLKVKQEEESRLIALIGKANKIDDIITLESRLSEIRSTVESYQSTLKNFDSLVQFSTINININEKTPTAVRYEPDQTFSERVSEGIIYSLNSAQAGLENLVISAARNMVGLIIFFIVLVILLVIAFKTIIPKIRGNQQ